MCLIARATLTPQTTSHHINTMNTCTYDLPAHWATALFYGNLCGFSEEEEEQFMNFLAGEQLPDPLSVTEESFFSKYHDAKPYGVLACDCLTYTFPDN